MRLLPRLPLPRRAARRRGRGRRRWGRRLVLVAAGWGTAAYRRRRMAANEATLWPGGPPGSPPA